MPNKMCVKTHDMQLTVIDSRIRRLIYTETEYDFEWHCDISYFLRFCILSNLSNLHHRCHLRFFYYNMFVLSSGFNNNVCFYTTRMLGVTSQYKGRQDFHTSWPVLYNWMIIRCWYSMHFRYSLHTLANLLLSFQLFVTNTGLKTICFVHANILMHLF